jgi:hypothetical protein
MQERPKNFNAAENESEATLVTPRFDAEEARHAHPVVPLAETRPGAPSVNSRVHARRGLRRSWPPALIVFTLLAVFAAGVAVASRVLSRPQTPAAVTPTQAAEVPAQAAPPVAEAQTPPPAVPPREEERANRQTPRTRDARDGEEEEARAAVVPVRTRRDDDKEFEVEDEPRRGRGKARESRRAREDDDEHVEKEMRKALKRAKGKAPRLVDVITIPSN